MSLTEVLSQSGLEAIDFFILLAYIIMLVSLGVFLSYSRESKTKNATDYFLAGNTLTWWAVGTSLIAANISAEQFIGMAGTGYAEGIAIAAYEIMAAITLVIIGKFLLPLMMERQIFTIPQFLRKRYTSGVGLGFTILWLFLYIFINLTSVAWLGALAIEQITGLHGFTISAGGISIPISLVILISLFLIAGIYSIQGGMTSVAWSDVMQATFIIGGGLATSYFALRAISGNEESFFEGCKRLYIFLTSRDSNDAHFHLVIQQSRAPQAFSNVPGIAAIVGGLWLTNFAYWAFNQYIVQKGLAAQNTHEAQKGFIFAAFLKLLIPFIVLVPGICAYYILQSSEDLQLQGSIDVSDDAYPWFIRNYIPTGIKGLALVALIASVISSLSSMLNSTSTLFTMDIYRKHINPNASDKTLMTIGRISAVAALIVAIITVKPIFGGLDQAFLYIQEYSGYLYPGIIIVLGLGLLWKRASTTAAIWTAILTIPIGIILKLCLPDIPFMFRAGYVFITLAVLFVTVSLCSKKSIRSQAIPSAYRQPMKRWGKILATFSVLSIVAASVVSIGSFLLPADATPDNNLIAYLNDIGFQSFYFFSILIGLCAIFLLSNATSPVQDNKALPINIALFSTSRGYTISTIIICLITLFIYILFW